MAGSASLTAPARCASDAGQQKSHVSSGSLLILNLQAHFVDILLVVLDFHGAEHARMVGIGTDDEAA